MADDLLCVFVVRFNYISLKGVRITPALGSTERILGGIFMLEKMRDVGREERKVSGRRKFKGDTEKLLNKS